MATPSAQLTLRPQPPFRLDLTAWTLRRQAHNAIDRWDGTVYRRVLVLDGDAVEVAVHQTGSAASPRLVVELDRPVDARTRQNVRQLLRRMLGLSADLAPFYAMARSDVRLNALAQTFIGMRPPRFPSLFEGLANAAACQQLSLFVGITLLNRISERYGRPAGSGFAFPRPADMLTAEPDELRELGFSRSKARTLLNVADACASDELAEPMLEALDQEAAIKRLVELHGIGRWSAEYALLRGLGRLQVFPGDDVGARKHLALWLGIDEAMDYARVAATLQPWHSYGGLIYFHLLLRRLNETGKLEAQAETGTG